MQCFSYSKKNGSCLQENIRFSQILNCGILREDTFQKVPLVIHFEHVVEHLKGCAPCILATFQAAGVHWVVLLIPLWVDELLDVLQSQGGFPTSFKLRLETQL